jgi:hypothetical protein
MKIEGSRSPRFGRFKVDELKLVVVHREQLRNIDTSVSEYQTLNIS